MPVPEFWCLCLWEGAAGKEGFWLIQLGKRFVFEKSLRTCNTFYDFTPLVAGMYENAVSSAVRSGWEVLNGRLESNRPTHMNKCYSEGELLNWALWEAEVTDWKLMMLWALFAFLRLQDKYSICFPGNTLPVVTDSWLQLIQLPSHCHHAETQIYWAQKGSHHVGSIVIQ